MIGVSHPSEDFPALSLAAFTKDTIPENMGTDTDVPDTA